MESGKFKSIRQRFSIWFVFVIVVIILIFSVFLIKYSTQRAKKELALQLSNISQTAKISLTTALWQYDHAYIEDYIDSLFLNDDLVFVSVFSENELIKTQKNRKYKDKTLELLKSSPKFIVQETKIHFKNVYIGKIIIVMSYERINQLAYHNSRMAILLICFIILAITITNYLLLQIYIFNPVHKLKTSAQRIALGDLDAAIDIKTNDEIGNLAATFDRMMLNIKTITTSRDKLNKEVTRRKRIQVAFEESNERFLQLANNTKDIFWLFDVTNPKQINILYLNPAFEKIWKINIDDAYKQPSILLTAMHPDDRKKACTDLHSLILSENELVANFRIVLPDQSVRHIQAGGNRIYNKQGKQIRIAGIAQDITDQFIAKKEREKLELQLQQAHKMEAIGTLAGGIAHDFNNILGIIMGNAELAYDDIEKDNPARLSVQEIITASKRAKDVVWQLLSFSRKNKREKELVDLSTIVNESLTLLRSSIPRTIEIKENLSQTNLHIMADPTQVHQILLNLCTNAAYAMDEHGGTLTVSLESFGMDDKEFNNYTGFSSEKYIKLIVEDTGSGIAPEIQDRIFEPYFTTKPIGKGTGMGLAVVHGIIKDHGGDIILKSEPKSGTTFEVIFPAVDKKPDTHSICPDTLPKGEESILFIDDEPSLLNLGKKMLTRVGYTVEGLTNPNDAVKLFCSDPDKFQLVITDMTMPEMTGDEIIKNILKAKPDTPIILCTGYSEKISKEKAIEIGAKAYVEKPIDFQTLAITIRKILDS